MKNNLSRLKGNGISRPLQWLLLTAVLCSGSGCSLFVMAGKAILGDPKVPSEFRTVTGTDLTKGQDAVVIICTAPHRVLRTSPSLQIDIVDRVTRNLESRQVQVVPSGDVAAWFDDHGDWGDYSEMAAAFDAKYVVHVDIREFDHRVPESENLMQGKAEGHISVHQVSRDGGVPITDRKYSAPVSLAFDRDFRLTFPTSYPVPRETRSEDLFMQGFMDRVALHISQHFYDYRMSESIH
ncbi:MAG: hypothetical protein RIK87_22675 [Fuerstiella sp.]